MHLVVGLGNPGPKYADNRHNVGFMVADLLLQRWGGIGFRDKFKSNYAKLSYRGDDVIVLKPLTFMNLSGEAVQRAMRFFKVEPNDVLVVHDELDLEYERVRIKVGGGTAGHNGLKSIVQCCGGNDFSRVRIGISRPRGRSVEGWVLSDFSKDERPTLPDVLDRAADAVEAVLVKGPRGAMNALHGS